MSRHRSCSNTNSANSTKSKSNDDNSESYCQISESETFKTLPYTAKYSTFNETTIRTPKQDIPVIEPKSEKYSPIPYIFRLAETPDQNNQASIKTTIKCPPFHVQLDHTIAVVWSMYASEEVDIPLGINQLQWAYSFLENVKDKDQTYPRDVTHCLDSISDELMGQYADLAGDTPTPKSSRMCFNPQAHSSKYEQDDEEDEPDEDKDFQDGSQKSQKEKSPCGFCTPKGKSNRSNSQVRFADDQSTCHRKASSCKQQPEYPFSVTYNDMKLHCPYDDSKKKNTTCNNSRTNSFLNDLRKDQLKKILAELDRLESIEQYIGNDEEGFRPYMSDQDLELKEFIEKQLKCKGEKCEGSKKKKKETKEDEEKESDNGKGKKRCEDAKGQNTEGEDEDEGEDEEQDDDKDDDKDNE